MTKLLFAVALCCALAACTTAGRVGLAVQIAAGVYCMAVTPEGKQALRNAVTGGVQLIACPPGTTTTVPPPPPPPIYPDPHP